MDEILPGEVGVGGEKRHVEVHGIERGDVNGSVDGVEKIVRVVFESDKLEGKRMIEELGSDPWRERVGTQVASGDEPL